jgi:DNA-binding response OmpR family regulator
VINGLTFDARERLVCKGGQSTRLRELEAKAFSRIIARYPGYVPPAQLYDAVYGNQDRSPNCLRVHVCTLNKKLAALGVRVVGHPGRGYLLEAA